MINLKHGEIMSINNVLYLVGMVYSKDTITLMSVENIFNENIKNEIRNKIKQGIAVNEELLEEITKKIS